MMRASTSPSSSAKDLRPTNPDSMETELMLSKTVDTPESTVRNRHREPNRFTASYLKIRYVI